MLTANIETFNELVLNSEIPTLVDFNATWCGPCQAQKPTLDELEHSAEDRYKIVAVDIDESPELAEKYEVSSIPCLVLFENGREKDRRTGLQPKNVLKSMLGAA